jgi:Ras-related C3 botulinum toxin substrate 1
MPNTPFIIVGTKMDLRTNAEVVARLRSEGKAPVTAADGERLAMELGAARYLECSALTQQGLKAVFDEAIRTALEARDKPARKKRGCAVA